jgi:hypothetical protein
VLIIKHLYHGECSIAHFGYANPCFLFTNKIIRLPEKTCPDTFLIGMVCMPALPYLLAGLHNNIFMLPTAVSLSRSDHFVERLVGAHLNIDNVYSLYYLYL